MKSFFALALQFIFLQTAFCGKCKFASKRPLSEDITFEFNKVGKYHDFKSIKVLIPKLDTIFECVEEPFDIVKFEIKFREKGSGGFKNLAKESQEVTNNHENEFDLETEGEFKPCTTYNFKLKAQFKGQKLKAQKLKNFKTGPKTIQGLDISNITGTTATATWETPEGCDENEYQISYYEKSDAKSKISESINEPFFKLDGLKSCEEYKFEASPKINEKIGRKAFQM